MNQREIMTALGTVAADATTTASLRLQAMQHYMSQVYTDQGSIVPEFNQDLRRNTRASRERPHITSNL